MNNRDFTTDIWVEKTPAEAFQVALNVRSWWSGLHGESFEGESRRLGDEFSFRAGNGAHFTRQKLVELVPDRKVRWQVTEADLNFVSKPDEWQGTVFGFDITEESGKTHVVFTHTGLVPEFECYHACAPAWTQYVQERFRAAINTVGFTTSFLVDRTADEAFAAINHVRGWWSECIEGITDSVGGEFLYYYKDVHISKMKVVESVPGSRVVWQVLENHFNFTQDHTEWKGNTIVFDISRKDGLTELRFTHKGLTPSYECYDVCRDAWTSYIQGSLQSLITTGAGKPNAKEGGLNEELISKWKLPVK